MQRVCPLKVPLLNHCKKFSHSNLVYFTDVFIFHVHHNESTMKRTLNSSVCQGLSERQQGRRRDICKESNNQKQHFLGTLKPFIVPVTWKFMQHSVWDQGTLGWCIKVSETFSIHFYHLLHHLEWILCMPTLMSNHSGSSSGTQNLFHQSSSSSSS